MQRPPPRGAWPWLAERWERLVSAPARLGEDERLGRLFNVLMVISTGIVVSLTIVFLLMRPLGLGGPSSLAAAAFPFAFIPLSLHCLLRSRRGRTRSAIRLYVWANIIAISAAAFVFDGLRSPAWQLYIWTITIAGTLLAPVYALVMAGGVAAYFLLLLLLQHLGLYHPPLTLGAEGVVFAEIAFRLIMLVSSVGLLTYLNMGSFHAALARLRGEIAERGAVEQERERLIAELRGSLANVRTLSGLLPMCAACKKIRDDNGYWNRVEEYLTDHTDARLSHGICPECEAMLYPED